MKSGTSSPATATQMQLMELTMQVMTQKASTCLLYTSQTPLKSTEPTMKVIKNCGRWAVRAGISMQATVR